MEYATVINLFRFSALHCFVTWYIRVQRRTVAYRGMSVVMRTEYISPSFFGLTDQRFLWRFSLYFYSAVILVVWIRIAN
jgi:hypothetical protein